jgi:hypothetical protein
LKLQTAAKLVLKRILRFAPTPNWTAHYPKLNRLERFKVRVLCQILLKETGHMVYGGPFSTMKLTENLELCWDPPMILGSYEEEVHDVINNVICMAPDNIIDIGAAFGYYAVGFALKIANTTVIAFESVEEPHWQELADLARINGVSGKVIQRGFCTAEELAKACAPNSFILCDCEGGEEDILQPLKVPALNSCKILIELHEFYRPNVVGTLISRFRDSHKIRIIEEVDRDPSRYRILKKLPRSWRSVAVEEKRWIGRGSSRITTWMRFMVLDPKVGHES